MSFGRAIYVLLFPVNTFRRWINDYPTIRKYFYGEIVYRLTSVTTLLEEIAFGSIQERLGVFLMKRSIGDHHDSNPIKITHEQIALELGTAREVVSRALKGMIREGIVSLRKGVILVLDRDRLIKP